MNWNFNIFFFQPMGWPVQFLGYLNPNVEITHLKTCTLMFLILAILIFWAR